MAQSRKKNLKNTWIFKKHVFAINISLETLTSVATTLPKTFRGKSKIFPQTPNIRKNMKNFKKNIPPTLFFSTCRRHFWTSETFWTKGLNFFVQNLWKFNETKPFSKKFVLPECISLYTSNAAATALPEHWRQIPRKHYLITKKIFFSFQEKSASIGSPGNIDCSCDILFEIFLASSLKTSSSKTKNKYKPLAVYI